MAFEDTWARVHGEAWPCCGCFCNETACASTDDPVFAAKHKFCCCKGAVSSGEDCIGEKGCLTGLAKVLCCVAGCSTDRPALGCCGLFCCGRPYGEAQAVDDEEAQFMEDVLWCCYCVVLGCGCGSCNRPCCFNDTKVCCFEEKDSSDHCWTDESGCLMAKYKVCCLVEQFRCPPTAQVGASCLGQTCCRTDPPADAPLYAPPLKAPARQIMADRGRS